MNQQRANQHKGLILKIAVIWLSIAILAGFLITMQTNANQITLSIIPEVPKTKEPIVATFSISNSTDKPTTTSYQLYVNGKLVESGNMVVAQQSSSKHQYAYANQLGRGEQVNFTLKARRIPVTSSR